MLKITTHQADGKGTVMQFEGKLAGEWVKEALRTWTNLACSGCRITIDLSALTSVDASGRRLLCEMHARGVKLVSSTLMTRGIIDEIGANPNAGP